MQRVMGAVGVGLTTQLHLVLRLRMCVELFFFFPSVSYWHVYTRILACTRVGTLKVATIYLQLIQNRYMFRSHKGLSPCDFHLIPKMMEPLRGIRFRTVPEILQAVDSSIRTINTTGAAKGILRLPHRWQRVVHNAGDYCEGQ